jgi:hypothetical protein
MLALKIKKCERAVGPDTMGRVTVTAMIENSGDLYMVERRSKSRVLRLSVSPI